MELPHWAVFILIAVASFLISEVIKPDFIDKMKTGRGKVYLLQNLIVYVIGALLLSTITNSWMIATITFAVASGCSFLQTIISRGLMVKELLASAEEDTVLPLDQVSYNKLPVIKSVLEKLGFKLHEDRMQDTVDAQIATAESHNVIAAEVAKELGLTSEEVQE